MNVSETDTGKLNEPKMYNYIHSGETHASSISINMMKTKSAKHIKSAAYMQDESENSFE